MLPRMRGQYWTCLVCLTLGMTSACGGSTPAPEEPSSEVAALDTSNDAELTPASGEALEASSSERAAAEPPPVKEPEFTEGMSVNEAIKAVPMDTPTTNLEPEVLSKPLADDKIYEPCKVGSASFKVRVAVWDGHAVGVDAVTTPKNEKLAECIKAAIRQLSWPDKVRSLNLVEYEY